MSPVFAGEIVNLELLFSESTDPGYRLNDCEAVFAFIVSVVASSATVSIVPRTVALGACASAPLANGPRSVSQVIVE